MQVQAIKNSLVNPVHLCHLSVISEENMALFLGNLAINIVFSRFRKCIDPMYWVLKKETSYSTLFTCFICILVLLLHQTTSIFIMMLIQLPMSHFRKTKPPWTLSVFTLHGNIPLPATVCEEQHQLTYLYNIGSICLAKAAVAEFTRSSACDERWETSPE